MSDYQRIGHRLQTIEHLARNIIDNALDLQTECRELVARPVWQASITEVLIGAESLVSHALDAIHEAQQRHDSMPIQIPMAAE